MKNPKLNSVLKLGYRSLIHMLPDHTAVVVMHLKHFGKMPDLKNPQTFNEKIAWRKLYQRDPRFALFADKIEAKKQVAHLVGSQHVIETLWTGADPQNIPFDSLEVPYVIKVNHSSGGTIFVRSAEDIDKPRIVSEMRKQLQFSHANQFREWAYVDIPRKIIIERMIAVLQGNVPEDYKFLVYHGRCHFIQVDYGRFTNHERNLYDRNWNLLPATFIYPNTTMSIPKPDALEGMIRIAETIGEQFDFVRVDLYSTARGILFGEATFYPEAGHMRLTPKQWDYAFGKPWNLTLVPQNADLVKRTH